MTQDLTVRDRDRTLAFRGVELARASSARPDKARWIELELHRVEGDGEVRYVLAGQGRSALPGEHTRYWAHQCASAAGVLEQLYMFDGDGTRYLTNVARQLLAAASEHDPELDAARALERVA